MNKSLVKILFKSTFSGLLIFVILTMGLKAVEASSIDPAKPTALVTGSNRGIGLAFTKYYLQQGWNVIATARSPDKASELRALSSKHNNLIIEQLDVTDYQRVDKLG